MSSREKDILIVCLLGVLFFIHSFPENGLSQEAYPTKPITMIIRSGAGGTADVMTRTICKAAERELGQSIVCENRAGGGGVVGVSYVLKSKPDGYTIGTTSTAPFINNPHMERLPYDPRTDVTDIMVFYRVIHALCVRADSPWNTFDDVVAYARQNPGKFTYSGAGVGITQHIVMERIAKKEGIKWSMVPFKSGSETVLACLGGHVNAVTASGPPDVIPHIEAGKLKLLLPLNDNRWPIAPNVPTVLEKYGFYGLSLLSVYGPRGISESIREKLQNAFKRAMDHPAYVEAVKSTQSVAVYMSGKDYAKLWRSHYEDMGKVIRELGLGKK